MDGTAARPHVQGMAVRGDAKVTTDHEFIRDWVERRGGCPAAPGRGDAMQIDYGRAVARRALEPIGWDEFFDWFERHQLAFQYEEGADRARFIDRASVVRPRARRRPR